MRSCNNCLCGARGRDASCRPQKSNSPKIRVWIGARVNPPAFPLLPPVARPPSRLGRLWRATTTVRPASGEAISFSISIFGYRVRRGELFSAGMQILLDIHTPLGVHKHL